MLTIGAINKLKIASRVGSEIYLSAPGSSNILLADKKPPEAARVGDPLDAFVYVDADGHLAATMTVPKAFAGEIAWLEAVTVNRSGAFFDWGLPKDLFVPRSELVERVDIGASYFVKLILDDQNRILGTTKIEDYLSDHAFYFTAGQKVSLLIGDKTPLGIKAIVNHTCWGLLYENEIHQPLAKGQAVDGYIKSIREDHKIDLSLFRAGYKKEYDLPNRILTMLRDNRGELPFGDNSAPEAIYATFGVSKKAFKQAIGSLYKKKLIVIGKSSIRLV